MPSTEHLIDLKGYLFEVLVNEKSSSIGMTLYAFKTQAGEDTEILGIVSENGSIKKVQNYMRQTYKCFLKKTNKSMKH